MARRTAKLLRWTGSDSIVLVWLLRMAMSAVVLFGIAAPVARIGLGLGGPADPEGYSIGWSTGERPTAEAERPDAVFLLPVELQPDVVAGPVPDRVTGPFGAHVAFVDPGAGERALYLAPTLLASALALCGLSLVLGMVRSLRGDELFTAANTRRLTLLAVLLIAGTTLSALAAGITRLELLRRTDLSDEIVFDVEWSLLPIAIGLGVAALAEVFRRATAMRVDLEGVI